MYWNSDKIDAFPDTRDPVTGDWLPPSLSDIARMERAEHSNKLAALNEQRAAEMLTSILK